MPRTVFKINRSYFSRQVFNVVSTEATYHVTLILYEGGHIGPCHPKISRGLWTRILIILHKIAKLGI